MSSVPTISIVSSEHSFGDITTETLSGDGLVRHPTLYVPDDMVEIRVENTLFRIPLYFFNEASATFAALLEKNDVSRIIHITDPDVSASAFANLLKVLRTPLGVTPISTFVEWTDVLHLASKWGFDHLRTAAIHAIIPLASPVDKLVLGRAYSFDDWVPSAYADLLEREEDLTVAEAKRMDIEDVVAVAQGRRAAKGKSRKLIDEIVRGLLPPPAEAVVAAADCASAVVPASATLPPRPSPKRREDGISAQFADWACISRWLGQMRTKPSASSPKECLVKFLQEDHTRVPLALSVFLGRGLEAFKQAKNVRGEHEPSTYSSSVGWISDADDGCCRHLWALHERDEYLGLVGSSYAHSACLDLVHHWDFIVHVAVDVPVSDLIHTEGWSSFIREAMYVAYLEYRAITNPTVWAGFWTQLRARFESTPSTIQRTALGHITLSLLNQLGKGQYVSKTEVSVEMDMFYRTLEGYRDAAQSMSHDTESCKLVHVIDDIFNARCWP